MKRDTVINVLLIIAGIVLALVMFWAGARWKSNASVEQAALTTNASQFRGSQRILKGKVLYVTSN